MNHRQWLAKKIQENGWTYGAELGVKAGENLDFCLKRCPDLKMVGVDDWRVRPGYQDWDHEHYKVMAQRVADLYGDRCTLVIGETLLAAKHFDDGVFDFVFIDADHSTDAVIADIEAWRSKVRPGGWLCGDDASKESVKIALDKAAPGWERNGRCWWLTQTTY